jgi:hypothetical protein
MRNKGRPVFFILISDLFFGGRTGFHSACNKQTSNTPDNPVVVSPFKVLQTTLGRSLNIMGTSDLIDSWTVNEMSFFTWQVALIGNHQHQPNTNHRQRMKWSLFFVWLFFRFMPIRVRCHEFGAPPFPPIHSHLITRPNSKVHCQHTCFIHLDRIVDTSNKLPRWRITQS